MSDYLCKCNNISLKKNGKILLNEFSLEIPPKRIIALIGDAEASGEILRIIAKRGNGDGGRIEYDSQLKAEIAAAPWKIQYVPDDIVCYRNLSAADFLTGITMNYGDVKEEKARLLEYFEIDAAEKLLEMTFEKNRAVAMMGSLLAKPTLLLLDCPFDMVSPVMYKKIIKEMVKTYFDGGTVVLTADRYEDIEVLCSDYIFIRKGKVEKRYYGRKNLPAAHKIVTIWGCEEMPGDLGLKPLCKKGDCIRFIYEGEDSGTLASYLNHTVCRKFTVEEMSVGDVIYHDYKRWML